MLSKYSFNIKLSVCLARRDLPYGVALPSTSGGKITPAIAGRIHFRIGRLGWNGWCPGESCKLRRIPGVTP
jgi:hypothetical protein